MDNQAQRNHPRLSLTLEHLRIIDTVFRERSITRAAAKLGLTQPALSRTLTKLRDHFEDPLFVRVGHKMEPTAHISSLAPSIQEIIRNLEGLQASIAPFSPQTSRRTFAIATLDGGIVKIVPWLLPELKKHAPNISFSFYSAESRTLDLELESGALDFVMGSFPAFPKHIRCQHLFSYTYKCVASRSHPRLADTAHDTDLASENHILITARDSGHAHASLERVVDSYVGGHRTIIRVSTFLSAAVTASMTDAVATIPTPMAHKLAGKLGLTILEPPFESPTVDVYQYWHERFHNEPGSKWVRSMFRKGLRDGSAEPNRPGDVLDNGGQ